MTRLEQYRTAFTGCLDEEELISAGGFRCGDRFGVRYECPCGDDSHYATRTYYEDGYSHTLSLVLHCWEHGRMWMVRPLDIAAAILKEEESYIGLLSKADATVKKVVAKRGWSDATVAFLKDTHGIDRDTAEEVMGLAIS